MPTCSAQTRIKSHRLAGTAFTLVETMVVILLVSLLASFAITNLFGLVAKSTFKAEAQQLVSVMQMAVNASTQTDKRYEVIIDPVEQGFTLREITTSDLKEFLDEQIITTSFFDDNCRIAYILFDDGDYTNDAKAKFRAGRAGWQYGGKIVLLDSNEKPYSILINRLAKNIILKEGDLDILMPKDKNDLLF